MRSKRLMTSCMVHRTYLELKASINLRKLKHQYRAQKKLSLPLLAIAENFEAKFYMFITCS